MKKSAADVRRRIKDEARRIAANIASCRNC
jgi:hypothetical protein